MFGTPAWAHPFASRDAGDAAAWPNRIGPGMASPSPSIANETRNLRRWARSTEAEPTRMMPISKIERRILEFRGLKVLLDQDLAVLYQVQVKVLNQAVKRNMARFPKDFMFRLSTAEHKALRSQSVTLESGRGTHRKYRPCAFTEQGVAMLSSVLRSRRATSVNIEIMRAFVRLRRVTVEHRELSRRLDLLEATTEGQFRAVFKAIRDLMYPPSKARPIGFRSVHVGPKALVSGAAVASSSLSDHISHAHELQYRAAHGSGRVKIHVHRKDPVVEPLWVDKHLFDEP
jgi:hypothetical protein